MVRIVVKAFATIREAIGAFGRVTIEYPRRSNGKEPVGDVV